MTPHDRDDICTTPAEAEPTAIPSTRRRFLGRLIAAVVGGALALVGVKEASACWSCGYRWFCYQNGCAVGWGTYRQTKWCCSGGGSYWDQPVFQYCGCD